MAGNETGSASRSRWWGAVRTTAVVGLLLGGVSGFSIAIWAHAPQDRDYHEVTTSEYFRAVSAREVTGFHYDDCRTRDAEAEERRAGVVKIGACAPDSAAFSFRVGIRRGLGVVFTRLEGPD